MTFSLSITGVGAGDHFAAQTLTVDDASAGTLGAQINAMAHGTAFLCKGPDGQQRLHQIDAERSTPGNLVLRRLT
jgi:hypothetical protein